MKELDDLHKDGFISDRFKEELEKLDSALVEIEREKYKKLKEDFDNMDCSGLAFG